MKTKNIQKANPEGDRSVTQREPRRPSTIFEPPPVPKTCYAVTLGRETGVYPDVRALDLAEVAAQPQFSMTTFHRWDDAVAFYTKQFNAGLVDTTGSGNTLSSPFHIGANAPTPEPKNKSSGLIRRNDSFSKMGTPTAQPALACPNPVGATGAKSNRTKVDKPQPSGAATRVRKAQRGPDGERIVAIKDVVDVSDGDSDSEDLIVKVKKPSSLVPIKRLMYDIPPTTASAAPPAQPTLPVESAHDVFQPLIPVAIPSDANPITPVPKRRYVAVYFQDESDFDDPAVMEHILMSACRTPTATATQRPLNQFPTRNATPGPSNSLIRNVDHATATPSKRGGTRSSSVPLEVFSPQSKATESTDVGLGARDSLPGSPSALSTASTDTEARLGYGPMDPNLLEGIVHFQ